MLLVYLDLPRLAGVTIRSREGVSFNEDNEAEEGRRREKEVGLMYTVKHANHANSS